MVATRKIGQPIDLVQNEIRNGVVQNLGADPGTPVQGQFIWRTDTKKLRVYDGSSFVDIGPGAAVSYGTPGNSAVADTAAAGVAATVARSDHTHGRENFAAPASTTAFGLSAVTGTAATLVHSDHTHGTPTHDDAAHSAIHISALTAPSADVSWASHKITNLLDPTAAQDAASKAYVDASAIGIDWKPSARAATTAALAANTYANGTAGVGATLTASANGALAAQDGVTLSVNDRLLVKNEAAAANNGLYVVTQVGVGGSSPYILTRATDSDTAAELNAGTTVFIESGTANAKQQWTLTTTGAITVGTTGLTFEQESGTFGSGASTTVTAGGSAGDGTAQTYARADHAHGLGAAVTPTTSTPGDGAAVGSSTSVARADHTHLRADGYGLVGTMVASAVGDPASAGTSANLARIDHKHARESFAAPTTEQTFGTSAATGSALTVAHSDHAHGNPTHVDADHSGIHLNALATATNDYSMGSHKITNLLDPVSAQDAATKNYVDAAAVGIDFKPSVQAATTGALPNSPTYANGASGVGATLTAGSNVAFPTTDGVAAAVNNRYLVKDQASQFQNGIYTLTTVGSGAAAWVLTRATDMDTAAETTAGALTYVEGGTVNGSEQWIMTTTGAVTMGTTNLVFTQFSGASTLSAGAGLTATGNVFAVGAGTGISVAADTVGIDTTLTARYKVFTIGDGATTAINCNHAFGNQWVNVQVANASTGVQEEYDVTRTDANNVTVNFVTAPATNSLKVTILG